MFINKKCILSLLFLLATSFSFSQAILTGSWNFSVDTVVEKVSLKGGNIEAPKNSGTDKLDLQIFLTKKKYTGGSLTGYLIASKKYDSLDKGYLYKNVNITAKLLSWPVSGDYYVVLALTEYQGYEYRIASYIVFDSTVYFNNTLRTKVKQILSDINTAHFQYQTALNNITIFAYDFNLSSMYQQQALEALFKENSLRNELINLGYNDNPNLCLAPYKADTKTIHEYKVKSYDFVLAFESYSIAKGDGSMSSVDRECFLKFSKNGEACIEIEDNKYEFECQYIRRFKFKWDDYWSGFQIWIDDNDDNDIFVTKSIDTSFVNIKSVCPFITLSHWKNPEILEDILAFCEALLLKENR